MITLQELDFYLNELLPPTLIPDYCPNGLQVQGASTITKAATAVSASLATIEEAVRLGAQALIVHHGLFWNRDEYVIKGVKREKIALLIKHNISLFAYHLPLDAHAQFGNNWKAAKDMGWQELEPFGVIGVKGKIPPVSRDAFQTQLEKYYNHPAQTALGGKQDVRTVALISGGAYKSVVEAAAENIDCFVSGNVDEPAWSWAHEGGVNYYALGHTATERVGPIALGDHIKEHFGIPCEFIDTHNPF